MEGTKCLEVTQAVLLRNTGNIQRDGQCGHRLEQVLRMAVYEWGCVCFSGLVPTYTVVFFFVSLDWHALLLLLYFVCLFVCFFSYLMVLCGCLVVKLCPTHWDPTNCSIPGFPALHCLLEFAQTHVHWLSDAIQPSHPLSPPSPPVFNLSQPQSLFQWVSFSHQVAKVLELQHQSFWWIFRVDFL